MTFGVLIHRQDSIYDDSPALHYQFPGSYESRMRACVGDWIIYYEPTKAADSRGYFAVAKIREITKDFGAGEMFRAIMEPGSYIDFPNAVPFRGPDGIIEQGLLNADGVVSGRAQSAVRPISFRDFNRIVGIGFGEDAIILPRTDNETDVSGFAEMQATYTAGVDRERVNYWNSRQVRDRVFRRNVVTAYRETCAVTGLRLINGGGRAEVEAAHIRPVASSGPDIVSNGIALSGTMHWMFDRGLVSIADDGQIMLSRQINDLANVQSLINHTGKLIVPDRAVFRPHPAFLAWHRGNCFKG